MQKYVSYTVICNRIKFREFMYCCVELRYNTGYYKRKSEGGSVVSFMRRAARGQSVTAERVGAIVLCDTRQGDPILSLAL